MIDKEIRHRAVVHYKYFCSSLRRVSKIYNVSKSSLHRWLKSSPKSDRKVRSRKSAFTAVQGFITTHMHHHPFTTMEELASAVHSACGIRRSRTTIGRYRRQVGFTRKKAFRVVNADPDLDRVSTFCSQHLQTPLGDVVCIDEAGFYIGDHPRMGYASIGRRLNILHGRQLRRSKFTLLMAIKTTGVVHFKVLDHNCKKADFVEFIKELPVPVGSALLMDNIAFHRSSDTVKAVQDKGCTQLFIPPYSPRFNAIENVFGALKGAYRKVTAAMVQCHTRTSIDYRQALEDTIHQFINKDLTAFMTRACRQSEDALRALAVGAFVCHEK